MRSAVRYLTTVGMLVAAITHADAQQAQSDQVDEAAARIEAQMTDDERFALIWGYMPLRSRLGPAPTPDWVKPSAGYFPGVERLGFGGIFETDASLGVTNPKMARADDVATALPSGLALASSFDPALAELSGRIIGNEARNKGFNVLLAGGVNLTRDWFGGRNFEYLGEDPLLAGIMAGASIKGIQSQHVVSSIKHFALNTQETQRHSLNATMSEVALRESDLMAFEIAMEKGQPGAVMCAYNMVNDKHGCSNDWLLNQVLRREWGFRGWVMSDWGATTGPSDIVAGLDQESGAQLDAQVWFDTPLKRQIADGNIDGALVGQSVRRILRSLIAVGADRKVQEGPIDYDAHAQVARQVAEEGIVLLKNDGVLPLADTKQRILVVGRFADAGVWSGGGSSQVIPVGGVAERMRLGGSPFLGVNGFQVIMPSSPLDALRKALPQADIIFDAGYTPETAAAKAARSDIVIVFANKWQVESLDAASLSLPEGQNDLIAQVTRANPNAIIVLETGNPVSMPWLGNVRAVVQAWYSGQQGAAAIADILSGRTNPSGHLPMTFPRIESQAPRSTPPGLDLDDGASLQVDYVEGSDVGYRWYARRNSKPLFAFGYGLSYTTFHHGALHQDIGRPLTFNVTSKNVGRRDGADVLQLYLVSRNGIRMRRLVGFQRLALKAGEEKSAQISIESRLLSDWTDGRWQLPEGRYRFAIGRSASDLEKSVEVRLATGLADSFKILP